MFALVACVVRAQMPMWPGTSNQYAGMWDHRNRDSFWSACRLNADGKWSSGDGSTGQWTADGKQLVMRYDAHPDWVDCYALPGQGGVLHGKDAGGGLESMIPRSAAVTTPFVGEWDFWNMDDGKRVRVVLSRDGMWKEYDKPAGYWQVVGDQLIMNFKDLGWVDTYDLPLKGDVLYGQNRGGAHLTLARNGVKPGEYPSKSLPEALTGSWNLSIANDNHHYSARVLNKDGGFSVNGKPLGTWRTVGDQLILMNEKGGMNDTYYLPPDNGMLYGNNADGRKLTLARAGANVPKEVVNLKVPPAMATAARTTSATAPVSGMASTNGANYFGKRMADAAGGVVPGSLAPGSPIPDGAAVTSPAAPALTPVGRWQWHSNVAYTFAENGAVESDTNVAGQWRWIDKDQGEIQVQWNLVPARPPENYTLSPHGDHLTWKNAPQGGHVHTEDRIKE